MLRVVDLPRVRLRDVTGEAGLSSEVNAELLDAVPGDPLMALVAPCGRQVAQGRAPRVGR